MKDTQWEVFAAAAIIAAAIYLKPEPEQPRYAISTSQWGLFRMDLESGETVTCNVNRCLTVIPAEGRKAELDRIMAAPVGNSD